MLKIGITGGIGAGKTTVCQIFELLNVPVYYADDRAKQLMTEDQELVQHITSLLGSKAYNQDGSLNRKYIATIVFNNKKKLAMLNALVHPAVTKDANKWFTQQKNTSFALKEAALLFEAGSYKDLDKIIVVDAPAELRIERVMKRDNVSREEVEARIKKQMPQEEKVAKADFVIYNTPQHTLNQQVTTICNKLEQLA